MRHLKRFICVTLLLIAFILPTTAFASNGNSNSQNHQNNPKNNNNQSWEQYFSSFFSGNKGNKDDDWKHYYDNNKDFKDWYDKHKNDCPDGESDDIWKKWFCY
ncbi:hypothetical protein [Paenibacillus sp. UNC451MF]|uniref:hypothetical protein n=1 Tax=Paenibacillus sp. UNC451MF TaxID=1449063 RepID=UPI00048C35E6|nr:hypothetical protein [Paenibacillus sp. UNC451MF]